MKDKVVVIGLDAADPDLLLQWAGDGVLPVFQSLLGTAAWGFVRNPAGLVAGGAWPSFYTGVSPARHGQYDGTKHFVPSTYQDGHYYQPSELPREPLWSVLSRANRKVAVVDAPFTFAPNQFNGICVHQWGCHERIHVPGHGTRFRTWPPELADDVEARFGMDPLGLGECQCDGLKPRNVGEAEDLRDRLADRLDRKLALSRDLLAREDWDFFLTVFHEAHCIGHQCWHLHDRSHPRYDAALAGAVGNPLRDIYRGLDSAVGALLDDAAKDTTVIVYCSHGMGPNFSATGLLDQVLLRLEGIESPETLEGLSTFLRPWWRRAPPRLRRRMLRLRAHAWESKFQEAIRPKRWDRKFFEVAASGSTGGVRFNLEGREARGRVKPGAGYETLREELIQDLRAITNVDTGKPLVHEVIKTADAFPGEYTDRLPDLLLQWDRSGPILRVRSEKIGTVEQKNPSLRTGDHKPEGLFLAVGPAIEPGRLETMVSVTDFFPTIAARLGVDITDVDGTVISAFRPNETR